MGIKGIYKWMRGLNVRYSHRSFRKFVEERKGKPVKVDMNACFYQWLLHSQLSFLKSTFESWFKELPNVTLVFDGERTVQKLKTAFNRAKTRNEEAKKLEVKADALYQREKGARIKSHIRR